MSLEVIEMMIKESLRDGEISASERETLIKQGELFGISKEIVFAMIDAEVEKLNSKIKEEKKKKQEAETAERSKELAAKKEFERIKNYDHDKKIRERFISQKRDMLYDKISEHKGKMPKKEKLWWIENVLDKNDSAWRVIKYYGKDKKEYEFPAKISAEWFVTYIKELEKEYSNTKKLAGGDGFIDKIKGLFKK
jgi:hypothetical protein